jgi:hypothetical protein
MDNIGYSGARLDEHSEGGEGCQARAINLGGSVGSFGAALQLRVGAR